MDFSNQITPDTLIQFFGLIGVILGLYFTARQIKDSAKSTKETLKWNQKTYTEDKLEKKPQSEIVLKLESSFNTHDSIDPIPLELILSKINSDKVIKQDIAHKLNRYERIARGIKHNLFNDKIVKNALGVHMVKDYINYSEYIEYLQKETSTGGLEEYSDLIEKWRLNKDFNRVFKKKKNTPANRK